MSGVEGTYQGSRPGTGQQAGTAMKWGAGLSLLARVVEVVHADSRQHLQESMNTSDKNVSMV